MEQQEVLALFDRQMRREFRLEGSSARVDRSDTIVRQTGAPEDWSAVVWSGLDAGTADAEIAEQVRHFTSLGLGFEWKLYGHDQPADLGDRLREAGFAPEDEETLMVAAISELALDVKPPAGVRFDEVTDAAGVDLMVDVSEQAFGAPSPGQRHRLLDQLTEDPANVRLIVAMAGDEPVCAARLELSPGTAFASLWGGGTVRAWRGKGVYRALVAHRARIAADLGYEYLQVDASSQSRPILERLGFTALTVTVPYQFPAPAR
ncbi:GNAT family N-acetyltransferase [Actinoplanes sp. NEAU-A12]|uniref:GNAT family N-acetyltransferase n=1 Tax=Actinoplanes sandaracinus TaxID=3045177 RepID=A0ABT6WVD2_9ACTN|nr:GNAT family N-acetyltransferase [Actinoplanes sandaracinus]MDI6103679.1 GNAT family N-acetyltransferase [Actinoplanes sandaracinus]